jgi:hypothetical protein
MFSLPHTAASNPYRPTENTEHGAYLDMRNHSKRSYIFDFHYHSLI